MVISGSTAVSASASASALHRPTHVMAATASSPSSSVSKPAGGSQTTLHNFPLPVLKTWGSKRILRCVKLKGKSPDGGGPDDVPVAKAQTTATTEDDGFDRVRAKLMVHLQEAAGKIDLVVPPREVAEEEQVPVADVPWKLRTRRGSYCRSASVAPPGSSCQQMGISLRPRSEELGRHGTGSSGRRRKFSLTLSKEEIDEDLYSMTGKRASRRPKKRPRAIKNQLDQLFPGYYLSEVTPDIYEMQELPPAS